MKVGDSGHLMPHYVPSRHFLGIFMAGLKFLAGSHFEAIGMFATPSNIKRV